jgi:acyl-CoA hydrolase
LIIKIYQGDKNMQGKRVSESAVNDQTAVVFPNDLNAYGTLFGGRVLDLGDRLAGVVARRHTGRDCVTLGIDSVRFLAPARHGDILVFKAAVNHVWKTSMEIGLKVYAEDFKTSERKHIVSAYFTFVALDDDLKPVAIPPVIPETEEEKRRYREADERRARRLRS